MLTDVFPPLAVLVVLAAAAYVYGLFALPPKRQHKPDERDVPGANVEHGPPAPRQSASSGPLVRSVDKEADA